MAPRKNALLPFVKRDQSGKLTYRRQVPPELRPFLGGKASIRRTLPTDSTDIGSAVVLSAYSVVHSEVEALIAGAKAQMQRGQLASAQQPEQFPLSPRDVAGISAEPLRQMVDALQSGRISAADPEQLKESVAKFLAQALFAKASGDMSGISEAIAGLTAPVLDDLQISASTAYQSRINQQMLRYAADARADIEKAEAGDFSEGELKRKAPAKPKRQLTWEELMQLWRLSTGGVLEEAGYGVSEQRDGAYIRAIKTFKQQMGELLPNDLTEADSRQFIRWLREGSGLAVRTQQDRLGCLKNLMKVGRREGVVTSNPFDVSVISAPAGADDQQGYRPLTKQEIVQVFELLKNEEQQVKRFLQYILLCQGCRLSEALQLRTQDIKQTDSGIWFINWQHEPTAQFPMLLKTKAKNNRQCPIHPRLIQEGFLEIPRRKKGRLFADASQDSTVYSQWFKSRLLKLGIWEKKKTVLHSLRGTARDLQREAGVPQDFRNAVTGHQSREVGESSYGLGLAMMPDKVFEQLKRVDLSWVP